MTSAVSASVRSRFVRYVVAVAASSLALALTLILRPLVYLPTIFFLAAVVLASWYGGLIPGMLATLLSVLGLHFLVVPSEVARNPALIELLRLLVFVVVSLLVGALHAQRSSALAALGRERDRLSVTMRSIGDAVISTDTGGRITFMNEIAEALTGWRLGEALGRPLDEVFRIVEADTGQPAQSPVEQALRKGITAGLPAHTLLIRRDGSQMMVDDSAAPIRDADGALFGVILAFRDITSRRAAEEALRATEERFRLMAETVPDILYTALPDGNIDYVNSRFYEYTGLPDGSALGMGWEAALHPDDVEQNRAAWRRAREAREAYRAEFRVRSARDTYRWFVSRARPNCDQAGNVVKWYGAATDIDSARRTQTALEGVNARLRDTLESITDAYFALDADYRFLEVNPVARQSIFRDLPDEELLGRVFWEVFPEGVDTIFWRNYRRAWETGQPIHFEGKSHIVPKWFETHAYPRGERLEVYLRDITDRKLAEQRTELLQELTSALSSAVTPAQVGDAIVGRIVDLLDGRSGIIALVNEDSAVEIVSHSQLPEAIFQRFHQAPLATYPGMAGDAMRMSRPLWMESMDQYRQQYAELAPLITEQLGAQAGAAIPLLLHDVVLGVLLITFGQPRHFGEEDRIFLMAVADQCAQAMERARLYSEEARARLAAEEAHRRTTLLQSLTADLAAAVTVEQIAEAIVRRGRDEFGAHLGGIGRVVEEGTFLQMVRASTAPDAIIERFGRVPLDYPAPLNEAALTGQPVFVESQAEIGQRYPHLLETSLRVTGTRALAALPLVVGNPTRGGAVIGVLSFNFPEDRQFSEADRAFFAALADQCAQAMERALLFEVEAQARDAAEEAQARMALLQELTAGFSRAVTQEQVADIIMQKGREMLGSHLCSVMMLAENKQELEIVGDLESQENLLARFRRVPLDHPSALPLAIRTGQPVWVENQEDYCRRFPEMADFIRSVSHSHSTISVPLITSRGVIGGLGMSFPFPRTFDEADRAFFVSVAEQCAQAIERARLYEIETIARHAAEEADQIRIKFLGMVSHELRNPLTSIKGFASTLLAQDVTWDSATQQEFIRLIDEEADKLSDLVEQLLDLSRMEAGRFNIQPVPTTPREIVESALPQLARLAENHQLEIRLPDDLPPVEADTRRIAQVMNNLVGNAAKFSPPGTLIQVTVRSVDGRIQFDISDQGPGIPPEDRERIFEAFRQGRQEPGMITKGAGLGLAIARGLIEAHHGRLWVQDRPGPGVTFSFTLPAAPLPQTAQI